MKRTTGHIGRREVLKKIAVAGVVIPAVGALGLVCNDDSACERRKEAPLALFAEDQAAQAEAERAAAQPVANRPESPACEPAAAAASQAFQLPCLPNPGAAPPAGRTASGLVEVELEIRELDAKLAEGACYTHWTFNGTVPGPMIRVCEGDENPEIYTEV